MDICFVTELSLNSVWQTKMDEIDKSDLLVFGFNGLGLVSYKKELSGETEYFHDAAKLSKQSTRRSTGHTTVPTHGSISKASP